MLRLQFAGYSVKSAEDGQDALNKIDLHEPDAIVMDLRMSRMDGLSALNSLKMRPNTSHIPVVMVSASVIDKRRALDAGARFFISKPYNSCDLLDALEVSLSEVSQEFHDMQPGSS
jgi:CheY-like chemotaxis protein